MNGKSPSVDDVTLQLLQQMQGHYGRKRLKELDSPEGDMQEEESKEEEIPLEELQQLLAQTEA